MLHIIIAIPTSAVLKPAQAGLVCNYHIYTMGLINDQSINQTKTF